MSTDTESPVVTAAAVPAAPDLEPEVAYKPKREAIWRVIVPPFLVGAATVGFWYFISYVILEPKRRFLLQPPHRVWQEGFADSETLSEMFKGLWSSGRVAFWGLLIAIALGFTLAIVMSQAKMLERAFFPYFVMLQAIPILAIVPLIGFWFGYGRSSRIVVCVIIAIFPIIVNTLFGLLSADSGLHDLLTLHGAGRLTRIRKVMFPAALPAIFAGLRISAGLSVIGAIVGDFFFGKGDIGIGQLLKRYVARIEGEKLLAAVILSCALGVAVFVFFGWLANRVAGKWAPAVRGKK